jgi:NodT family efflux transporter outer membrane factor (OMF) lipoprotein
MAVDYFQLRTLDADIQLLNDTARSYERSLELTQNRHEQGIASGADVAQAEAQLESTRAQAIDLGVQRAALEHAIAVLIGKPPADFSLPPAELAAEPPDVPVSLPSDLLERRPDVATAERSMASANAQIGVALSAYYPTVTLSGSGGFESGDVAKWLMWPSRFWSAGPSISQTVYDAGRRAAQTEQARAAYDETVDTYRQTVLSAFQEVEDQLAALRILEQESGVQARAVKAAQDSVRLTTSQYEGGIVSYLNVVVVNAAALADERTAVDIQGRRLAASVLLVQGLGGGWSAGELPTSSDLARGPKF